MTYYYKNKKTINNLRRINWNTRLINGRNKTRHVSFKDSRNQLFDPLIIANNKILSDYKEIYYTDQIRKILLFFTQCKIFCLPLPSSFFWFPFVSLLLLIRLQSWYPLRYTLLVFLNTQIAIVLIQIIEFSLWQVINTQLLATCFSDDFLIDGQLLRISASTHLPLAKSTPERETVLFVFAQKQTFRRVNYIKRG